MLSARTQFDQADECRNFHNRPDYPHERLAGVEPKDGHGYCGLVLEVRAYRKLPARTLRTGLEVLSKQANGLSSWLLAGEVELDLLMAIWMLSSP